MIELKQGSGGSVEVTFRVPTEGGERQASVAGEFNGWSTTAHPMRRDGDGFTATITLEAGRTYRFRYLLDGERWVNDWAAHAYVPNEFGGDDSLVDLSTVTTTTPIESGASPSTGAGEPDGATVEPLIEKPGPTEGSRDAGHFDRQNT